MAASRPSFKVAERTDFGSRTARRLRRDGFVPGIVYTGGAPARPFQADAHDLALFIGEGHALFDLEIEGEGKVPVVIKEEQRHPVRGDLVHLDCQQVDLQQEIQAEVAIELSGAEDAPGAKEGGILEHVTREVTIEALPTDIPNELVVDVSEMGIGDTIQLDSMTPPDGVKFVADAPEEVTIATLNPPRVVEEEEPELEEETGIVGEDEEEAEEAAAEDEGGDEGDSGSED
ncbi:MAG TPA: 50S ribosomal protein L25 [Solirubrobacterales bacterium]|nr:50S ribosomal protein L25 [Solirubrobacterales bacterium]